MENILQMGNFQELTHGELIDVNGGRVSVQSNAQIFGNAAVRTATSKAGAKIGTVIAGPVGTVVGAGVGWIVGAIWRPF